MSSKNLFFRFVDDAWCRYGNNQTSPDYVAKKDEFLNQAERVFSEPIEPNLIATFLKSHSGFTCDECSKIDLCHVCAKKPCKISNTLTYKDENNTVSRIDCCDGCICYLLCKSFAAFLPNFFLEKLITIKGDVNAELKDVFDLCDILDQFIPFDRSKYNNTGALAKYIHLFTGPQVSKKPQRSRFDRQLLVELLPVSYDQLIQTAAEFVTEQLNQHTNLAAREAQLRMDIEDIDTNLRSRASDAKQFNHERKQEYEFLFKKK